jgi:hypothetical protein
MMKRIATYFEDQRRRDLFFVAALIGCFFIYRYEHLLTFQPSGPHTWRQADCVSIIDNYYSHGMRFFWPEIHYQISDGDESGYTAGEFPGLYYVNALLWKIFGKHIPITRGLSVLIMFIGLFALYRTHLLNTANFFWSTVCSLLLLSTPAVAEYGANFLTDVPGFSFALMGWYFFERFRRSAQDSHLAKASVLFMIAGLLKVSSLILFVVIVLLWLLELVGLRFADNLQRTFERPLKQGAILFSTVAGVLAWYQYASYFNSQHAGKYTFNSPWPIWSLTKQQIVELAQAFWNWTAVFTMPMIYWYVVPVLILLSLMVLHRLSVQHRIVYLMTLVGVLAYFAFWYQAIDQHDYYFVNGFALFVVMPNVFLTADLHWATWLRTLAKVLGAIMLLYGLIYTRQNLELRHFPQEKFSYALMPKEPVSLMKWYHWERKSRTRALPKIQPLLDSLGVDPNCKVVILPDPTINHTLYLIDHKGWTSFGGRPLREIVDNGFAHGAEYLLIVHGDAYFEPNMAEFKNFIIGELDHVDVIDLKAFAASQAM